jgi:hypothetical protein
MIRLTNFEELVLRILYYIVSSECGRITSQMYNCKSKYSQFNFNFIFIFSHSKLEIFVPQDGK